MAKKVNNRTSLRSRKGRVLTRSWRYKIFGKFKLPKIFFRTSWLIASVAFSSILIFFVTLELSTQGALKKATTPTSSQAPQNLVDRRLEGSVQGVASPEQALSGLSIRLRIPKIKVNTALESVGLTPQGAVGVPKSFGNAAWFNLGPRPGEMGSAVIDGHFGWKNGVPGAFNNLYKLRKGDKLYVEEKKGSLTTFVVREVRTYDPKAKASDVFRSSDGKVHLNLITCEGVWDKIKKSYSNRLVVFADKETE